MERYQRRQTGTFMLVVMFVVLAIYWFTGRPPGSALVMLFVVLALFAFAILRTSVDESAVRWSFTFGWPAGHVDLSKIESVAVTTTNFLEGWGIHWTIWHGWLWNVSGFQAVEIHYDGGKIVTLGTDDPQGLLNAIERSRTGV
jgi:hypothetical protein